MIEYKLVDWAFDVDKFSEDVERLERIYTVEFMAATLGVSENTLHSWKRRLNRNYRFPYPNMTNLIRFCNQFDLDPRQYFVLGS